jgi:lysozyme
MEDALRIAAAMVAPFEGFRPNPYVCPAGVWTIGYGTTRYQDGRAVGPADPMITEPEGREFLAYDLSAAAGAVERMVRVPITAGQKAALISFAHNCGAGALQGSTLLRKLNAGDMDGAAAEFGKWVRGGGQVLPGLVKRRAAEAALFRGET